MADGYGRIPRWVKELIPEFGPIAMTVYVALSDHCNERRYCHPSYTTIQEETGLSRTGVADAMKKLYACGAVIKLGGVDSRSVYHLPMDRRAKLEIVESTTATSSPRLPENDKLTITESTTATGSLGLPVVVGYQTGSLGLPPSEQEPRIRTKKVKVAPPLSHNGGKQVNDHRGTRIDPTLCLTPDYRNDATNIAEAMSVTLDVSAVWDQFRDYWLAIPGRQGVKLDWQATWRNWVRRACEKLSKRDLFSGNGNGNGHKAPEPDKATRKRVLPDGREIYEQWAGFTATGEHMWREL